MSGRLSRVFFARPCIEVAPELLGCLLVHELNSGVRLSGTIVEVEAYLGDGSDAGSHSHNGPTRRNASMFGPPGRFYVYRSMGIHLCANLVCEPEGSGAAVLLRAVEPREGIEVMRKHRSGRSERELTNGPAKLTEAFGIGLEHDGHSALRGPLRVEPSGIRPRRIVRSPRIGLSKGADLWQRFFDADSPWVSRSPLNRRAR
jgi:DNA-3-methyladenine glycosylase